MQNKATIYQTCAMCQTRLRIFLSVVPNLILIKACEMCTVILIYKWENGCSESDKVFRRMWQKAISECLLDEPSGPFQRHCLFPSSQSVFLPLSSQWAWLGLCVEGTRGLLLATTLSSTCLFPNEVLSFRKSTFKWKHRGWGSCCHGQKFGENLTCVPNESK